MEITPVEPQETAPVEGVEALETAPAGDTAPPPKKDESPEEKKILLERLNLQKQRKAFLRQQAQFKKEREEWEAQRQQTQAPQRDWKQELAKDPMSVLKEAGISYEQLTNSILNGPNPQDQTLAELREEIRQLREGQTKTQEEIKNAQTRQYEQALKQIGNDVKMLVQGNEEFEMIEKMQAEEAVTAYIEHKFNDAGVLLSIEEAAREVEEYLTEKALEISNAKKIQAKRAPVAPPAPAPAKPGLRTLTHQTVQSTTRPLTDKDRRARAIAAFKAGQTG